MISIGAFKRSVCAAYAREFAQKSEEARFIAAKRVRQARLEREWLAEQERRREAEEDADGSRAAAREARQQELEDERLAFMAGQIIKQQRKRS